MQYEREVYARYDKKTIRVYQAYHEQIAKEALALQTFGESYNVNRMTWIKPSFLWMMHRSGWGTKKNQEYILALDIDRMVFDDFLKQAVLTSPKLEALDGKQWEKAFSETVVYCQWDPDRNINGDPIGRAAIQMGLKGEAMQHFLKNGIVKIEDMTPFVKKWNTQRKAGKLQPKQLPMEQKYTVADSTIRKRLGM